MAKFRIYGMGKVRTIAADRMFIQIVEGGAIAIFDRENIVGSVAAVKISDNVYVVEEKSDQGLDQ